MWKTALRTLGLYEPLRRVYRAARPRPAPIPEPVDAYNGWLANRQRVRAAEFPLRRQKGRFSILTYVYERSPAELFRETANTVFAQTDPDWEWVLLAQGTLPEELENVLRQVARDRRVRLLREPTNLGIIRAARKCLEAAQGRYVLPLDGDDLLMPDTLQVLGHAIATNNEPAFLYSDEDVFIDGRCAHPYIRPDWDPVLNCAGSYAWHCLAFRRDLALQVGIYSDTGSEYCQDWDSITRFALAGHRPLHVREILYHWRAHANSSTNKPDPNSGSLASQRHLLHRIASAQPHPERYEVQEYPIFRGAFEWGIARRPIDAPAVSLLVPILNGDSTDEAESQLRRITAAWSFPFTSCETVSASMAEISAALLRSSTEFTVICSSGVTPENVAGLWEAIRLFEFHPELAVVTGRILNPDRFVVGGGELFGFGGGLTGCPEYARVPHDPGPWAFLLKQRCVDAPNPHFFVARTEFLRGACARQHSTATFAAWGHWLGGIAAEQGELVATSPMVVSHARPCLDVRQEPVGDERAALLSRHAGMWERSRWYNPLLGQNSGEAYQFKAA